MLGLGGSFPVAAHLTYVLRKLGRRVVLLDGLGSALGDQADSATPQDALIAISFKTYNPDTRRLFPELVARKVPAVAITDSLLSPIVEGREGRVRDPRHAGSRTAHDGRADVPCAKPRGRTDSGATIDRLQATGKGSKCQLAPSKARLRW